MKALNAVNFPLSMIFIMSQIFGQVMHSFSLNYRKSLISFFISNFSKQSFSDLFIFHEFIGHLFLLKSSFNNR